MSDLSLILAKIPIPVSFLGIIGVIVVALIALGVCWFLGVMIGAGLGKLLGVDWDLAGGVGGVAGVGGLVIGIAIVYFDWQFMPTADVFGIPADIIVCFVLGPLGAVLAIKAFGRG